MSKLTPPPWHWEFHPDTKKPIALVSGPHGVDVLLVTGNELASWAEVSDEHQALLAAAPDLLAAAEAFVAFSTEQELEESDGSLQAFRALHAAIAKARGG